MIPPATRDELARVLRHYPLGKLEAAERIRRGFVNDNWVVTTDQGLYFVKRRHPDLRRPAVIRAQHALIRRLGQAGFPAPAVIPTKDGQTLLIIQDQYYEVQAYVVGRPYDYSQVIQTARLAEAARVLGRYHRLVQGFAPPALCALGPLYHPALLKSALSDLSEVWGRDEVAVPAQILRRLRAHADDLSRRFARHGPLPQLVIHGDYYAGNLLFWGNRVVGVVDYDKACWQPRVVELAEALIYFASPRPGHLKYLVYPGFLDWVPFVHFAQSYAQTAPLEANEARAVPDYVRCIWTQVSLARLKTLPPPEAVPALKKVLALADWASTNADRMVAAIPTDCPPPGAPSR